MNRVVILKHLVRLVFMFSFVVFAWLYIGQDNIAHAATLPTPTIQSSSTSWTNQTVHMSLSGSGGTLQYQIDGGGGNGTTADGGTNSKNESSPDDGPYYFAKNRFIDMGINIPISKVKTMQFSANTGSGNPEVLPTNVYGSTDGAHWVYLGDAKSNAMNSGQYASYPLSVNNESFLQAGFASTDYIRYVKAHNDYCLDSFWMTVSADRDYSFEAGGGSAPTGIGTTGNYGGTWSSYNGSFTIESEGVHSIRARAIDGNGSSSDYSLVYVSIDKTAPAMNVTGNPTSETHKRATLQATAEDEMSGIKRIRTPDGIWNDGGTATYKISKNGNYTFIAEDKAGNQTSQTVDVTNMGDELWMSKKPTATLALNPITLSGTKQTIKFSGPSLNLEDNRETGQGWHISVSASPFTDSKNHTLPAGSFQMKAPVITGTDNTPSSPVAAYQAIDLGSSLDIVKANTGQGEGAYLVNMDALDAMQASIPASTYAGSYQSNILWQLSSAP